MTTQTKRTPGKGIARPPWSGQRAQVTRIAIYKITGFSAIGEAFGAAFAKPEPQKPRYWRVAVGIHAKVSPEDAGLAFPVTTFTEAVALADGIRRRGETFHRLQRMMPSRLRPRSNHPHFEHPRGGVPQLGATYDEIHEWERNQNHV